MSSTPARDERASNTTKPAQVDMKLEALVIPVADVDRAKRFYAKLGWRLDAEFAFDNGFRGIQFTPPGSPCSIQFGTKMTTAAPGSAQNLYLVVSDIDAARAELGGRGVEVSYVFHAGTPGAHFQAADKGGRVRGPAPDRASYGSFATFTDPDGNGWVLQEVSTRLPGRGFSSLDAAALTELLRETEQHHGRYEAVAPKHHWSGWYAAYIVARERGRTSDEAAGDAALHMERIKQ